MSFLNQSCYIYANPYEIGPSNASVITAFLNALSNHIIIANSQELTVQYLDNQTKNTRPHYTQANHSPRGRNRIHFDSTCIMIICNIYAKKLTAND